MTAPWRTIQRGDLGTVLCWHNPGAALAPHVPGWTVLEAPVYDAPPPNSRGPWALVGYSAGCQGVRAQLSTAMADHVVLVATIDGTHDRIPPASLDVWRRLAARARAGELQWIATCLDAHTYVEGIPVGAKGRAMATVHVLEAATGLRLEQPPSRRPSGLVNGRVTGDPAECRESAAFDERGLHVRAYASSHTDHAEHAAQVSRVLPALWRELAAPYLLNLDSQPDTEPGPAVLPARPLGERIADAARDMLRHGVREVPGPASNPQISAWLYPCRRGGTPCAGMLDGSGDRILGNAAPDSIPWCAASRSLFVFFAGDYTDAADRAACPHGYRCAVHELCSDARARRTLRPADGSYVPQPGDAAIYERNGANPLHGGEGHVNTVITGGLSFTAIGGNESDALGESTHRVGEPGLVAFITCAWVVARA